ncbi:MAG: hypothetical protein WCT08_04430 [Patescibacteria group bacterium]|jgi:hypothetical protein
MKNKQLFSIIIPVVVIILAIGIYKVASISKNSDNESNRTNVSNANTIIYKTVTLVNSKYSFQIPQGYIACENFNKQNVNAALIAYVWSDGTCDHTQDAPEIQVFAYAKNNLNPEKFLRQRASEGFMDLNQDAFNLESLNVGTRTITQISVSRTETFIAVLPLNSNYFFVATQSQLIGEAKKILETIT